MIPAIENSPIFFVAIDATLFDDTIPDSNIAKPGAINITRKPQIKNNKVLKIYCVSAPTLLSAEKLGSTRNIKAKSVKDKQ
jgi:hypothetical protein